LINDFAPEVDLANLEVGDFGLVQITETAGYDLVGTLLSVEKKAEARQTGESFLARD
jgi:hypothetical protein